VAHYTPKLPFLAVVPVGHRVRIEIYRRDVGVLRPQMQPDPSRPVVVDLETGVRWMHQVQRFTNELHDTYFGRVLACDVETDWGNNAYATTHLTIDPTEPPR